MMFVTLQRGAMTVAMLMAACTQLPAPVQAQQANCQWYGTTALKQQQENEQLKCGLVGPAWNSDLRAHIAWCASVATDTWRQMARKRDQDLAACAMKKR